MPVKPLPIVPLSEQEPGAAGNCHVCGRPRMVGGNVKNEADGGRVWERLYCMRCKLGVWRVPGEK